MKRLVICFDGTWQSLDNPATLTNVVRVGQAVYAETELNGEKVVQITYYLAGVGTSGGADTYLGGIFGAGLELNVRRGLEFLSLNWNSDEDEIYIFGFSRGAYSARALAGVISAVGGIPKQEHFDKMQSFWDFYLRDPAVRNNPNDAKAVAARQAIRDMCDTEDPAKNRPMIKCVAVWDTVGSYGIPAGLGLGSLARRLTTWTKGFHDTEFGAHVEVGLHAMAIDEQRRTFPPTAWTIKRGDRLKPGRTVEQVWFAGSHGNIGGGYDERGLSDLSLIWMMARVQELCGLQFDADYIGDNFWPCGGCALYNSNKGWLISSRYPYLRPVLSGKPASVSASGQAYEYLNEKLHWSVAERLNRKALVDGRNVGVYRPKNVPAKIADDKIAHLSKTEMDFIQACHASANNTLRKQCALYGDPPAASDPARARRIAEMRTQWLALG